MEQQSRYAFVVVEWTVQPAESKGCGAGPSTLTRNVRRSRRWVCRLGFELPLSAFLRRPMPGSVGIERDLDYD